ncbi:alpha/beta-hydrolase [Schizopora paradoxa]|uniref:Alpha/beta-hydrolase n=1 Tax=Schizopora paradoxa TaxID=27342 RepID=A0A0H2RB69_9AGAM|nr:alpha/beta-hydrolase [Schizopora paradoxa]
MAVKGATFLSFLLVASTSALLAIRFLASFPLPPEPLAIHPSLASLPQDSRSWKIYPEDFFEGGQYASFPFGKVRYWLMGPKNGEKVVLVHGFSVPSIIWRDVAPQLASKGFRVLVYDLYGRGYSDAPWLPYDASLYTTQLALLMQHVKWDQAHIAGLSMGGGVAAAFAANFPHLVSNKVGLIASAGLMEASDFSRTSKVMSSRVIQLIASSTPVRMYMQRLGSSDPPSNPLQEIVQIQSAHLPGYNHALASSLRNGPLRGLSTSYEALSELKKDVMLIWGTADRTVPYKYASKIQELVPNSTLLTIEDGGHDLTISHPSLVSDALIKFFRTPSARSR